MVTENTSGSQTATVTTEHTLATITDAGAFVLAVDVANLANDDELELRAKIKVRSSDTSRTIWYASYAHAQATGNVMSIPIPSPHEVVFTLLQTAGTGRAFPWAVYEL